MFEILRDLVLRGQLTLSLKLFVGLSYFRASLEDRHAARYFDRLPDELSYDFWGEWWLAWLLIHAFFNLNRVCKLAPQCLCSWPTWCPKPPRHFTPHCMSGRTRMWFRLIWLWLGENDKVCLWGRRAYFEPPFVPDYSARLTHAVHTKFISVWTTGRSGEDANDPCVVKSHSEC